MQQALNVIELQGHFEEEVLVLEAQQPAMDPPAEAIQVVQQAAQEEEQQQPRENCYSISAAAYSGCPSDSTLSLLLNLSKG